MWRKRREGGSIKHFAVWRKSTDINTKDCQGLIQGAGLSTEKKSWPSGQNERVFARLRPVFVVSKVPCQPPVRAGLALVSREYPWFFHGDTVGYDREGTQFQVDRSISALSTLKSVFRAWLALTFLPSDSGLQKKRQWGRRDGWSVCKHWYNMLFFFGIP